MLFNSFVFLQFFCGFILLYYLIQSSLRARNILIVCASYLFYGWWDSRFLILLILSSLVDFWVGLRLAKAKEPRPRKLALTASVTVNLTILGFFKYFNFFADSFAAMFAQLGLNLNAVTLNIVLPVGISFYTFQSMSYSIDVYRGKIKPTRSLINFLAYVSFFPQLVAGPIERAHHLLPQFESTRRITRQGLEEGCWLILWGMFKKVVIADQLAPLVEMAYDHPTPSGFLVFFGTLAFAFQIYGDFSGYSDIARGLGRVLGFDLMLNFNLPYAATNLQDFWRRWHISLSSWLRDYLYFSVGGNRRGRLRTYFNLLLTMLLGGLWHGAAWNFVLWGAWHGIGLSIHRAFRSSRPPSRPRFKLLSWIATMLFVLYGWLLFRAESWAHIQQLTQALVVFHIPIWGPEYLIALGWCCIPLILFQIIQFRSGNLYWPLQRPAWQQSILQGVLLITIILSWQTDAPQFIYFQF